MNKKISITHSAAEKINSLIREEKNNLFLRIFISGGGCSGFEYSFAFENNKKLNDTCILTNNINIIIDPISYQYIIGSIIDYKIDISGERFVVNNPNAKNTCGCGSSFAI